MFIYTLINSMCLPLLNLEMFNTNWGVIRKKKIYFLISYLAVTRPTLTLNGIATAPQLSCKCYSCFQTLFIINYHINLSCIKSLIPI